MDCSHIICTGVRSTIGHSMSMRWGGIEIGCHIFYTGVCITGLSMHIYAVGLNVYGYVVGQKINGSHICCTGVYIIGRSMSTR